MVGPRHFCELYTSRRWTRFLQWTSEREKQNNHHHLVLLAEGGETEPFRNTPEHPVFLNKVCPQENLFKEHKIWVFYQCITGLGEGKHPTRAHSSHHGPPKGQGDWALVRFRVRSHRLTERLSTNHRATEHSPSPTPYHHITKSLFTGVPFTRDIMYSYQKFTRDTKRQKKTHQKNNFEETEQASEPGSAIAGTSELSKVKNSWKKPEKKKKKKHSTYRGTNIKITSNLSETMPARRKWSEIFKSVEGKKLFT